MKILEINTVNFGSTGSIMCHIAGLARENGHEAVCCYYARRDLDRGGEHIYIGNKITHNIHKLMCKYTGYNGCGSVLSTWNFLRKVRTFDPDIIHLHNLHNCYINLPMLFKYIKKNNKRVVWTLHDCWSFTGQCPHFVIAGCDKWRTGCHDCPQIHVYPSSKVDRTRKMWNLKREWFTGVQDMTIVTPSEWLAGLVKQSYLKDYPVRVINNGIDLNVFKPCSGDWRRRNKLEGRYVILGVASIWEQRKGIDVFIKLAVRLDDRYQIVLVGTNEEVDKTLPDNIITIHRTSDQHELAEIYSSADLFVNTTREENYPSVNMEAIACGTPVLTFRTGGSPEIPDEHSGAVVDVDDIDGLEEQIRKICEEKPFSEEDCVRRAESFDHNAKYNEYLHLFDTKMEYQV
ncbi:Glycosyltransferase involved in cell wall bisynthesis [Ruminococcaceae bacterium YRB3002]|nr:Glycosyltransferase involved in cell wall bisynthesis [Ruminococcaceae bacterium YRB3002]